MKIMNRFTSAVNVDYTLSVKEMGNRVGLLLDTIFDKDVDLDEVVVSGDENVEIVLIENEIGMSTFEILDDIDSLGYRAANIMEMMAYVLKTDEEFVVALGTEINGKFGIYWDDHATLGNAGLSGWKRFYFAAVKK
ncbi:TPA: hypothetical protein DD449_04130 [Candidatus Berkelbacteria bacterium]|uniref:Uncharacterized protein n=1 Tax=Berkelbacteria bacterium GW2011_GWE1_39_12 TaxID=1618337 RepID=A0A0G4B5J7_9BACT|nr:MAG: hypothetical protein UT28_C0001G0447 [Berkelbacteria bacterium GW2011_GWE1_39_12]HBO60843.1 hypothetical protein [Candidatus Berkelbacteria bacterium]